MFNVASSLFLPHITELLPNYLKTFSKSDYCSLLTFSCSAIPFKVKRYHALSSGDIKIRKVLLVSIITNRLKNFTISA